VADAENRSVVRKLVLTHPASIGVPHDVRIVRTLEPRLLWPARYRIDASRRTDVMGQIRTWRVVQDRPEGAYATSSEHANFRSGFPLAEHLSQCSTGRPRLGRSLRGVSSRRGRWSGFFL